MDIHTFYIVRGNFLELSRVRFICKGHMRFIMIQETVVQIVLYLFYVIVAITLSALIMFVPRIRSRIEPHLWGRILDSLGSLVLTLFVTTAMLSIIGLALD